MLIFLVTCVTFYNEIVFIENVELIISKSQICFKGNIG